ncbi:hypothetical protein PUNSTDRAFT_129668 [Punctularia strigosozonata HHB-11173 SS5]|uniref:uncharacterized protein n=1 Tax=Punctularia strigosozonata (strain HHB-11173) TaxID=741275 RepID=UPI0004417619|nr:uncharacterized protein PUNSTDRAFT_129668 [Punctularia strigosozonata HHB-11173 SS5]EIN14020.1 hypothetical protein PUNSTDRAFT_129668 [Punctularia strigosozonata HHB-11173 SS5]
MAEIASLRDRSSGGTVEEFIFTAGPQAQLPTMTAKLDKELSSKLEEFNKSVAATADEVIFRVFPSKILYDTLTFAQMLSLTPP